MIYHFIAVFTDPDTQLKTAYHYSCFGSDQATQFRNRFVAQCKAAPSSYTTHLVKTTNTSWQSVIQQDCHFKALQVTEDSARIQRLVNRITRS